MRTPAVLVSFMVVSYIFQEFFQLLGIETFAAVFSVYVLLNCFLHMLNCKFKLALITAISALCVWTYSRYSGQWRDAQVVIDESVKWAWDNFLAHLVSSSVGPATNFTLNQFTQVIDLNFFFVQLSGLVGSNSNQFFNANLILKHIFMLISIFYYETSKDAKIGWKILDFQESKSVVLGP